MIGPGDLVRRDGPHMAMVQQQEAAAGDIISERRGEPRIVRFKVVPLFRICHHAFMALMISRRSESHLFV